MVIAEEKKRIQTETKPHQSNALHPNELVLGRISVMQPRVRPMRGKKPTYAQN